MEIIKDLNLAYEIKKTNILEKKQLHIFQEEIFLKGR